VSRLIARSDTSPHLCLVGIFIANNGLIGRPQNVSDIRVLAGSTHR
jgi:hypothetical protein